MGTLIKFMIVEAISQLRFSEMGNVLKQFFFAHFHQVCFDDLKNIAFINVQQVNVDSIQETIRTLFVLMGMVEDWKCGTGQFGAPLLCHPSCFPSTAARPDSLRLTVRTRMLPCTQG